jgi:WD40 repeat protein
MRKNLLMILGIAMMGVIAFFLLGGVNRVESLATLHHPRGVIAASYDPNSELVATSDGLNCTLRLWDVNTWQEATSFNLCSNNRDYSQSTGQIAYSPDGNSILVGGYESSIAQIIDAKSGEARVYLLGHSGFVRGVSWNPNGATVATASKDGTAIIWDANSGEELLTLTGHSEAATSISFNFDGSRLVTASEDNTARIWDARTGNELLILEGHQDNILTAFFSPNGERVITSSYDGTTREWDAYSGAELRNFVQDGWVSTASYSFDGRFIIIAEWFSDIITIREANTGSIVRQFRHSEPNHGHLSFAMFIPNDYILISGAGEIVNVWNIGLN